MKELLLHETQEISGGGPLLAIAGGIIGAFVGCVVGSVNCVVNKDSSTKSLAQSIGAFSAAGAGMGAVAPGP
jgi:hypothetical protein